MLIHKVNVKNTVMDKLLLTPHQEIGLGQLSRLNRGCLMYRLYSSKASTPLSDDSWSIISAAFPFFSFFFIKLSIHASVDESANKELSINIDNQKKKVPVEEDANGGEVDLFWDWDASYLAL